MPHSISRILSRQTFWIALCCLPILLNIVFIILLTPDAVYQDMFTLLRPTFDRFEGTLSWKSFGGYHAGHIPLVPRVIVFVLLIFHAWNPIIHFLIGASFAGGFAALLFLLAQRTHAHLSVSQRGFMTFSIIALYIFWTQFLHQHLTWGILLVNLSTLGAILILDRSTRMRSILLAGILCAVATFSFGQGMLSWFVMLPLLLQRRDCIRCIPYWLCTAGLSIGLFFLRSDRFFGSDSTPNSFLDIYLDPLFLFNLLGRPFSPFHTVWLPWIGAIVLGTAITLIIYHARDRRTLPWICLLVFGLLSSILINITRGGLGIERSLAIWYTSITGVVIVSAIPLLWFRSTERFFPLLHLLTGIVLIWTWSNLYDATAQWYIRTKIIEKGYTCLANIEHASFDCIKPVHANERFIRSTPPFLRALGLLE